MTADELTDVSIPGKVVELIRGHLVVREPPGTLHGVVAANLTVELGSFVREQDLGVVSAQDTGFKIARDPDTVRGPGRALAWRPLPGAGPAAGGGGVVPGRLAAPGGPRAAGATVRGDGQAGRGGGRLSAVHRGVEGRRPAVTGTC
ncbi:MAG: hypothetical protein GWN99_15130 [Gemmatimonadetes bacterium]|nr:hypothetical protein [Gemmatimonadota bacterium]